MIQRNNIPKKIHYIWFWKWKKPKDFKKYLSSWKKFCPDYEIIEWNEDNFDVEKNYYCKKFYDLKKWAFASDYARFDILYNEWWIYLDTDMEIIKNIDKFLDNESFFSFQDAFSIAWTMIWAKKHNLIIKEVLDSYNTRKLRTVLPNLLDKIFRKHWIKKYSKDIIHKKHFTMYPKEYFCPYAYYDKKDPSLITEDTYAIHHYEWSWLPDFVVMTMFPVIWFFAKKIEKK